MDRIYLALTALLGGVLLGILGLLDSHEDFDPRKFGASVIRSFFAGVVFALAYQVSGQLTILDMFSALLAGGGFDTMVNRIGGALGNGSFPLSSK